MKIGLVGPSYQQRSLPFDAQRTVNLFPVFDQQGKEVAALYGTPGLESFTTAGTGPARGCFAADNGRAFVVSGSQLIEISASGMATVRGSLNQSSGNVSIAENGTQLAICDGETVYIFTYSSNAFAEVSDVDLPSAGTITFIGGYFVVNRNDTGEFYISALYDGFTWAALDFATAEASPDDAKRVIEALGQLWILGDFTTEIYSNTGASDFPFERTGTKINVGIVAPHTAIPIDNSLLFLGNDKFGTAIVYRLSNFTPQRISTEPIEIILQSATDRANITAYAYQQEGHVFYVLTGGGLPTTLVYDLTTQQWHERAYLNAEGEYEQHLANCCMFAFNKHLVGSRVDGAIYSMDMDVYTDAGDAILRERIYTHISDENKRFRYNSLEIGVETGVGLQSGEGSEPTLSLQLSKDGARTWSANTTVPTGAVGEYSTRVRFRRLGITPVMTFRIKYSEPTKFSVTGSYLA